MTDRGLQTGPSPWVARFLVATRPGGRMLDVACGGGRHLLLGLERGFAVTGVDRDGARARHLAGRAGLTLIEADLEDGSPPPWAGTSFDAVVVTNYLWRPILGSIVDSVAPDGILVYETFAAGNERLGRPSNPDFLLRPGELLEAVRPRLTAVAYEHVRLADPTRIVARIAAVGPLHPWLADGAPAL